MRRFWTDELREVVGRYLSAKEAKEAVLKSVATRLFGRFSKHFALWHAAVGGVADVDVYLSLAAVSASDGCLNETELNQN